MSSKNKIKGTAFETAVVNYINNNSCLNVERRALSGMNDKGDIIGVPDTAVECKNVKENVGVLDMTAFGKCRIKGPKAEEFLDYLVANKLPKKIGRINLCHALTVCVPSL